MPKPFEAVLFDFDHTLGFDHQLEECVLRDLARQQCGLIPTDAQISAALVRFRTGQVDLATMLSEAFAEWGYRGDILGRYKAEALTLLPSSLEATAGANEIPARLQSAGLIVAILSNGWTELQCAKAALIDFGGPVIVSEEIGAWKPDSRAFEIACERLGVDLGRSLYVGDSPAADVAGSKNAGMISVWADFEGRTYPPGVIAPDFTIRGLGELLELAAPS